MSRYWTKGYLWQNRKRGLAAKGRGSRCRAGLSSSLKHCGALLRLDPSTSLRAGLRGARPHTSKAGVAAETLCHSETSKAKTTFVNRVEPFVYPIDTFNLRGLRLWLGSCIVSRRCGPGALATLTGGLGNPGRIDDPGEFWNEEFCV
jgi:hypothetical protein